VRRKLDAEMLYRTAAIFTWFAVRRFFFVTFHGRLIFVLVVFVVATG
jgi:hypothetical protein